MGIESYFRPGKPYRGDEVPGMPELSKKAAEGKQDPKVERPQDIAKMSYRCAEPLTGKELDCVASVDTKTGEVLDRSFFDQEGKMVSYKSDVGMENTGVTFVAGPEDRKFQILMEAEEQRQLREFMERHNKEKGPVN